ncbi:hypothetical protein BDB01DRAFT_808623 [Pilobolus umbonatus]|nr:hypothetical protein BDB01DRAFT_808623 [Pilobolus umbonatus]
MQDSGRFRKIILILVLFFITALYLNRHLPEEVVQSKRWVIVEDKVLSPGISSTSFHLGLSKCQGHTKQSVNGTRHRNPRGMGDVLIVNGRVWLGDRYENTDVLIRNGLIVEIGQHLEGTRKIDAAGRIVTPGIVDMHSHMGVESLNGLYNSMETNEMTSPTTPYVRVIDALSPTDPGIRIVASGGITTSLILPGSANLMGGEAAVIKLRPVSTLSNQDMLISAGVTEDDNEEVWRYMKMACGENPKQVYGSNNQMPKTRMGENYLFRRRLEEAQQLKRKQDDWCDSAQRIQASPEQGVRLSEAYPEDLMLESLVALLRHQVNLNIHCYLPQDIEAMIQHSIEFDFEIAAFHHALSAWQITEIIQRANYSLTIATFSDMWGYKAEAWDQNVHAPKILDEAGIPVAFKSDHPVMNARDLLFEAQKAYHYGFDEHKALASLTSVPADSLKLGHRIGRIDVGKDADVVIWDRHPLQLGARPSHVIIDGEIQDYTHPSSGTPDLPSRSLPRMHLEDHGLNNPLQFETACKSSSFVMKNISHIYLNSTHALHQLPLYVVVEEGVLTCIGSDCDRDHIEWPRSSPIFEMGGATLLPGLVSVGVSSGLSEIDAEATTQDGYVKSDVSDSELYKKVVRAVDGLKLNGLHLQKAYKAGVTTTISQPLVDSSILAGLSVAFRTGLENTLLDRNDSLIKEEVALHFVIQHENELTVSQQMASIRDILISNLNNDPLTNVFARASQGQLPVIVQVDNKDEIASILMMKNMIMKEYQKEVRFVILGGAESHLIADHLNRLNVPVILMPARCFPVTWQSQSCLMGPPLSADTTLDILLRKNVTVAIGSTDADNGDARNLIWEAGWNLAHNKQLTPHEAVGLVTWNIAQFLGLEDVGTLTVGKPADFVAYSGNPLQLGTSVVMVHGGGRTGPTCFPQQI